MTEGMIIFETKEEFLSWSLFHNLAGLTCGSDTVEITEFPVLAYIKYNSSMGCFPMYIEFIND